MCRFPAIVLFLILWHNFAVSAMTEAQMKATAKMVRNVCQPKTKATNEIIDGMHQGNWDMDRTGKCYLYCVLTYVKLMTKDNNFDMESALKQMKTLPPEKQAPTSVCLNQCEHAIVTTSDKCEAAYELTKCIYMCNPKEYFLP